MTLSEVSAERIALIYQVATRHGSLISVRELSRLLPESASESELAEAISSTPSLSSKFELQSGYLTERSRGDRHGALETEMRNREIARINMAHASRFVSLLHLSRFKMVAVSGSTSYGSPSRSRDLDIFCVAPAGRMWLSLTQGLLMARAFGLLRRTAPPVCLSCVTDEDYARNAFVSQRDPLFARDALQTKVVKGRTFYRSLLSSASWISSFYPHAYDSKAPPDVPQIRASGPSSVDRVVNHLLFFIVGRYLAAKSSLLNRKLNATGRRTDVFETRSGEDHLIYESRRYTALKHEYRSVLAARTSVRN